MADYDIYYTYSSTSANALSNPIMAFACTVVLSEHSYTNGGAAAEHTYSSSSIIMPVYVAMMSDARALCRRGILYMGKFTITRMSYHIGIIVVKDTRTESGQQRAAAEACI